MTSTKILIVDDRRENIFALSQLIQGEDVQIFSAQNADEALDLVVSHDFGLALMDVQMPVMSGFQLARLIRGVKRCRNLPIIFLTAHQREEAFVLEGYETGAVDLLFKPLNSDVVRSKVRVFVQMDRQKKQLEEQMNELERLRHEADTANVAKSRFLANMSHEIRTPLSAVLGFADVLMQEKVSRNDRDECVSAIRRNGQLLLRLIDDILDLSKIEAHRMEMDNEVFDLQTLLNDVHATLSLRATDKGITLNFEHQLPPKAFYLSDSIRIKQTLLNIIGNAIKFTSQGQVAVRVQTEPVSGEAETQILRVNVIDTGVGLTSEQVARLFQPFTQADASTRRSFGGSGLGLVISRQIARLMGGDLRVVNSQPGQGSEFELSLQMTVSSEGKPTAAIVHENTDGKATDMSAMKILIADDVSDNRILIERMLKPIGAEIRLATTGTDAVKLALEQAFDLIIMDIQMPEMDGYEATQKIRMSGFKKPIIALTAHAMREERERCRVAGCNDVLTKPVNRKELVDAVTAALRESRHIPVP